MGNFLIVFMFALTCLGAGFYFGFNHALITIERVYESTSYELPQLKDGKDEISFTYCRPTDIREAFKVVEGVLPKWALAPNIDVMISPEFKIIVHKDNGYNVVATQNDYLIRDSHGDYYACPIEMFETTYLKVETPEITANAD